MKKRSLLAMIMSGIVFVSCSDMAGNVDNPEKYSIQLLEKAESGNIKAMNSIGWYFFYGRGVNQDMTKAFEWFVKGAENNNVDAINNVGWCYKKGLGVKQDYSKSFCWYKKGAEKGSVASIRNLAESFKYGYGVKKNRAVANDLTKALDVAKLGNIDLAVEMVNQALKDF